MTDRGVRSKRLQRTARSEGRRRCRSWLLQALVLMAVGVGGGTPAAAEDPMKARLQGAIAAYGTAMESDERDLRLEGFRQAERLFRAATESGIDNAALYANLGNAALQAEHLGPAVLAYRRALLLEPGLERAQQNLQHTRGLLPDWVPTPAGAGLLDSFFGWHLTTSQAVRANLAALFFVIATLCLAGAITFRVTPPRYAAGLSGLVWLALILSLAFDPGRSASREAVVIVEEATARAADSINAPRRFGEPLPGGTELTILEDRGGWLQVELHNGRNAWLTTSSVERVAEP